MTINPNFNVSVDNPFLDSSSLGQNITQNDRKILSDCQYGKLQETWSKSINLITGSNNNSHSDRTVNENSTSACSHLNQKDRLEAENNVFSSIGEFHDYIFRKIPDSTYERIAKTNPHYFEKVITHLEQMGKDMGDPARLDTFGKASRNMFLVTAGYLRKMMRGGGAANPGNVSPNPSNPPTIINHYHNNIGHIGDNYFGNNHFGDNNFLNKNGNLGRMFKKNSNSLPYNDFQSSSYSRPGSYYSPMINGRKFLEMQLGEVLSTMLGGQPLTFNGRLTQTQSKWGSDTLRVVQQDSMRIELKGQERTKGENIVGRTDEITIKPNDDIKSNQSEINSIDNMTFSSIPETKETEVQTDGGNKDDIKPKEEEVEKFNTEQNLEKNVNSKRNLQKLRTTKLNLENLHKTKPDLEKHEDTKIEDNKPIDKTNFIPKSEPERIKSEIRSLRDKFYRLWNKIHQGKTEEIHQKKPTEKGNTVNDRVKIFDTKGNVQIKGGEDSFTTLQKLGEQCKQLRARLNPSEQKINGDNLTSVNALLTQIAEVTKGPRSDGGVSWETEVTEKEPSDEEAKMSPDEIRKQLIEETQKIINDIKTVLKKQENDKKNA